MSSVSAAIKLANRGLAVFPLARGTKNAILASDWATTGASSDAWEVFDKFQGGSFNIGVRATGLVILDVDCKGTDGFAALAGFPSLPDTFAVRTPSGGRHFYFDAHGERIGQRDLAPGINVRATNGYVVGPGSEVGGKLYEVENDAAIAPLPAWLAEHLKSAPSKEAHAGEALGELDTEIATESAIAWLESNAAPIAVSGQCGNNTSYYVACRVMDRGISPESCLDLMLTHWNDRCDPPWEDEDLSAIVESAARNRQAAIGRDNPASGFEPAALPEFPVEPALEYAREIQLDEIIAAQANAIIKGLVAPGDNGTMYGVSGGGKSFVALDMAFHIAHGVDWYGHKVKRAPVLYCALEGVSGFRKRVVAITREMGDPGDYFARLKIPVTLAKNSAGMAGAKMIAAQAKLLCARVGAPHCVIVIDTKARATAGDDENSAADMSAYIEHRVGYIIQQTGAFVLTVHHENKNGGIRGSTVQPAADDLILHVAEGRVIAQKVKDGEEGPLFDFRLQQMKLGVDVDGVPVTTCVVEKSAPAQGEEKKPRPKEEIKPVKVLREAYARALALQPAGAFTDRTGSAVGAVQQNAVREEFFALYGGTLTAVRRAWDRAFEKAPGDIKVDVFAGSKMIWIEAANWD
ncbi:hypothetical protein APY04_0192 [Hyphomicrobium sulfonivorans]|uniref:DNA primase/polymerase bifunctional N-terminal domain-containing protein n=1 Tax=Hyphomicrobium sulfonivorans TaxID=121290 RepID=A0A109BP66_HYPSL|nr:AAA family ATPase [Hyphomicrobium sulfonivorans]KWT72398.1 hypothetical protein APY04_0192 [Hyphomicrobium sulfonivorans]